MSYQRFGEAKNPDAYIWSSGFKLHICAEGVTHDGTQYPSGVVEVVFDVTDTATAQSLFVALHEHLLAAGSTVSIDGVSGAVVIDGVKQRGKT